MSLKSAFHLVLVIAFLFTALGGITLATPTLADSLTPAQGTRIQPALSQPGLACLGCSGNGGGPG